MESSRTANSERSGKIRGGLTAAAAALLLALGSCSLGVSGSAGNVSPELSLKGLSSEVSSLEVRVTGPGIDRSFSVTPSSSELRMELPPAEGVKFEVEGVNEDPGIGPVYSWGMTRYADLAAGETTELEFVMGPYDTKILVPDNFLGSVIQLASLDPTVENAGQSDPNILYGSDWVESDSDLPRPFEDVALDNQGRIWMSAGSDWDILMLEDFGTGASAFFSETSGIGLAFDKFTSRMYFLNTDGNLGRFEITPTMTAPVTPEFFNPAQEPEIYNVDQIGLAVDENGNVYFPGFTDSGENPAVFKYDPSRQEGSRVLAVYTGSELSFFPPKDIILKRKHIYLTNPGDGPEGSAIVKLTKELEFIDSFGTSYRFKSGTPSGAGDFFNPARFLAPNKEDFYIMDDGNGTNGENRIIRFSDINGDGWTVFNPQVGGSDDFSFFEEGT
jgi:hypothetical protein